MIDVQIRRRLVGWDVVLAMIPMSKPTIYRMIRQCNFPAPLQISAGRTAFFEDELLDWIESRQRGARPINLHLKRPR